MLPPEKLSRYDLISFCKFMQPGFMDPPHLRLVAGKLEEVAAGKTKRLIVTLPPRHGKSWLISRYFPAWYMGRNPTRQLLNCTHGGDLSTDFGREVRDLIEDEDFQLVFPGVRCKQDSHAANRFHVAKEGTKDKGIFKALTRQGKKSGRGGDLLLIDDLLDEMEIYSDAAKEQARRAVRGLRTRLMPGAAIVMIMSRCAEDDPVGYVLDEHRHEGWEVLSLPAIAESDESHAMPDGSTWTRKAGEALWPEQYPLEALEALKAGMPLHEWCAKFGQRPIPMGTRLVEEEWFKGRRYEDSIASIMRRALRISISGDTSKGTATGSRTALGVFGETREGAYLVGVAAERWQVPTIIERLFAMAREVKPHNVLIEDKSTGEGIIQTLEADPEWKWPIVAIMPPPGMDKLVRFSVSTPAIKAGQLLLPIKGHPECRGWQTKFEDEFFRYPNCATKDQGDMVSQYLNWRRENPLPLPVTKSLGQMAQELSEALERNRDMGAL